jgi:BirA family biotin operon repressor/biotin-[acetyl-CoA-carboxylase] ligase
LRAAALARALGLPLHAVRVFARLRSTNQWAATAVESNQLTAPSLVVASIQTAGCGQHDNRWWSDSGSLCATFLLPVNPALPIGHIPLRAGLAVAEVLARLLPTATVQVKWPNDVLVDGKKIAGILCARARGVDLIGLGLNHTTDLRHAPSDVRARATSLRAHLRHPPTRTGLLAMLWTELNAARAHPRALDAFTARHVLHQRTVTLQTPDATLTGTCHGIDCEGRLLLATPTTRHALPNAVILSWR